MFRGLGLADLALDDVQFVEVRIVDFLAQAELRLHGAGLACAGGLPGLDGLPCRGGKSSDRAFGIQLGTGYQGAGPAGGYRRSRRARTERRRRHLGDDGLDAACRERTPGTDIAVGVELEVVALEFRADVPFKRAQEIPCEPRLAVIVGQHLQAECIAEGLQELGAHLVVRRLFDFRAAKRAEGASVFAGLLDGVAAVEVRDAVRSPVLRRAEHVKRC